MCLPQAAAGEALQLRNLRSMLTGCLFFSLLLFVTIQLQRVSQDGRQAH